MTELTANVNWLAVIIGAIIAYALGMLWFSPKMFGAKWALGSGLDPKGPAKPPTAAIVVQAIGTFLLAWLVGVTAANNALATIILAGLALIALMAGGGLFIAKSSHAITAETAYVAAMLVIMIAVQGIL
jgi:hypothetical protein